MKKILIGLMVLLASSVAFADTLYVVKDLDLFSDALIIKYKNMKKTRYVNINSLKDNEYMLTELGLYYKVDGKLYLTSMYELEFD